MINPAQPENQAYHVTIPFDYLPAIGALIAHWGAFEKQFCGFIEILARHPDAALLRGMPPTFAQKAKRLRELARIAFTGTPTLAEKISDFSLSTKTIADKRNVIVHGFWWDMGLFDPDRGVEIATEPDGSGDFYSVKLDQIEALAKKVIGLKREGILLHFPPPLGGGEILTPSEWAALQAFHAQYPPFPRAVFRRPGRRGTPEAPEPLEA